MWLEAIVPKEDLTAVVAELTPLTIRLGDDGRLSLSKPTEVALVEGVGLRVVCTGQVHWSMLGVAVPVNLHSLAVLLRPEVDPRDGAPAVVFRVEIEHADVAGLPDVIDDRVTQLVNRELRAKHVELSWGYGATLSHVFDLPETLQPLERLALQAGSARVRVTPTAAALAIEMTARGDRGQPKRAPVSIPADRRDDPSPSTARPTWTRMAVVAGLLAGALSAAFALGRSTSG